MNDKSKHIQQKSYADCGISCIAMACNVPYDRVLASVAPDSHLYGLYYGEVLHALYKISNKKWVVVDYELDGRNSKLSDMYPHKDMKRIFFVRRNTNFEDDKVNKHYIYLEGKILYDPSKEIELPASELKNSPYKDWPVLAVIYCEG
jgi:hypothetical protein